MIKEMLRAIKQQQLIRVIYLGNNGQTTIRVIRPLEVEGNRLKAYCLTRRGPRVFAINNILAIEPMVNGRAV
ncbi:WYL domain-containing protein [Brevibacillus sp. NRS-1366]|uniref:WYL domain-containing protein n=1 Tax=Brevibacillus sp. NRS-1366 TaxID=3233899 RepID=UPI003D197E8F